MIELPNLEVGDEVIFTETARERFPAMVGLGIVVSIFKNKWGDIKLRVLRDGVKTPDTWDPVFWRRV
jgi:hypothetical protein